tara:strand:+ start:925 stop:1236 length:312 start_codon:yes stop_codon:yes gene_type:complete
VNQEQFFQTLSQTTNAYKWSYEGNQVVGVARNGADRGKTFNPVTAVARTQRLGTYANTKRGTITAANQLGLSQGTASSVLCTSNRGNAQVVRGRTLRSLGIDH